jgi:hypothetical protein
VTASGAEPAQARLRRRVLLSAACIALAGVATAAAWPLISRPLADAAAGLGRTAPEILLLAGVLFALAPVCCGLAWREAIVRAGGSLGRVDACARYGVGSLVNSVAPAHLGDLARAVLLLERLPCGTRRRILPWFGVIQGARLAALAALAIAAAAPGPLALLALLPPAVLVLAAARRRTTQLVLFAFAAPLVRVAAIAVVLAGLGIGSPVHALAVVPALALAALVPLTPGNVGVAGAAAAGALYAQGIAVPDAVLAGLALHAIETAAGLTYGTASALVWLGSLRPFRGLARAPRALRSLTGRAAGTLEPEATRP